MIVWRRLVPFWLAYKWKVVVVAGLVSVAMIHGGVNHGQWWGLGPLQRTLEVFGIGQPLAKSGSRTAIIGGLFFALLTLFTLWNTWRVVFDDQRQFSRLWRLRDHTIVCGFGDKGQCLVSALEADSAIRQTVVVDRRMDHPALEQRRRLGRLAVVGDAVDLDMLRIVGVRRARHLVVVSGNDEINAQIAISALELCRGRRGEPLTCLVHVDDPALFHFIREHELGTSRDGSVRLQCFNVHEHGARAILDAHPPATRNGTPSAVLVVGLGRLGQSLVVDLARRRWFGGKAGANLDVTVVDPEASSRVAVLQTRYPRLADVAMLNSVDITVQSREFQQGRFVSDEVDGVYICLPDPREAIAAALAIRPLLRGRSVPLVVRVSRHEGLAALVTETDDEAGRTPLRLFPLISTTCSASLLESTTGELLARALHAEYLRSALEHGQTGDANSSLLAWDALPERLRCSNRRAADDVRQQLAAIGYDLLPLVDWTARPVVFSDDELDRLSSLEHERWRRERVSLGWRLSERKDESARTHPDIVPWERLGEESREANRAAMRKRPELLARLGFQIVRRTS